MTDVLDMALDDIANAKTTQRNQQRRRPGAVRHHPQSGGYRQAPYARRFYSTSIGNLTEDRDLVRLSISNLHYGVTDQDLMVRLLFKLPSWK